MHATSFLSYYRAMFFTPSEAFRTLHNDGRRLRFGLLALLIPACGYTLFYILASQAGGAPSTFPPWLNIPLQDYFTWGIFLSVPGYLLAFFFASGLLTALCGALSIRTSFESVAAILGFGVGVGSWSGMLHDLTDAILGFLGLLDMAWYEEQLNQPTVWMALLWTVYTMYFVWFFLLFFKGIRATGDVSRSKAALFAGTSVVAFQSVLLLFIR